MGTSQAVLDALRRMFHDERGSTITEVAFCLPVLFLMVFGFINFSLVMYGLCDITYGTHAAVRYASLHSGASAAPATSSSIASYVGPYLPPNFPSYTQTISVTYPSTGTNTVGGTVQIVVTLTYKFQVPGYALNNFKIKSTALGVITV